MFNGKELAFSAAALATFSVAGCERPDPIPEPAGVICEEGQPLLTQASRIHSLAEARLFNYNAKGSRFDGTQTPDISDRLGECSREALVGAARLTNNRYEEAAILRALHASGMSEEEMIQEGLLPRPPEDQEARGNN